MIYISVWVPGKERSDPNRLRYATPEFYFKTQDEMYKLFKEISPRLLKTLEK